MHAIAGGSKGPAVDVNQTTSDNQHSTTLTATKARLNRALHNNTQNLPWSHPHNHTSVLFFGHLATANPGVKRLGVSGLMGFVITYIHHNLFPPNHTIRTHNSVICRHFNPQHAFPRTHNTGTRDTDLGFAFDVAGQSGYLR
jgi:hypothetical protein